MDDVDPPLEWCDGPPPALLLKYGIFLLVGTALRSPMPCIAQTGRAPGRPADRSGRMGGEGTAARPPRSSLLLPPGRRLQQGIRTLADHLEIDPVVPGRQSFLEPKWVGQTIF
jgi:hypothetical protein